MMKASLNSPLIQRGNFIWRIRIVRSLTNRRVKIFFRPASAKPT